MTLGEISSQPGAFDRLSQYTAGDGALHMAYTLSPLRGEFDWPTVSSLIRDIASVGVDSWACWSFSNHDVERAVSRWNPQPRGTPPDRAFARMLMTLLLTLRGSICLFQGGELAMTEAELTEEDLRDPFGMAYWPAFRGRDGSRTPMPWSAAAPQAGFTTGTPWLPVRDAHRRLAVDTAEAEPTALIHTVRSLLAQRRDQPALRHGTMTPLDLPCPIVGFVRQHGQDQIIALFNLSAEPTDIEVAAVGTLRLDGYESRLLSIETA